MAVSFKHTSRYTLCIMFYSSHKNKIFIMVAWIALFLFQCYVPYHAFDKSPIDVSEERVVGSFFDLVKKSSAHHVILGDTLYSKLSIQDPVIEINEGNAYRSYCNLLSFEAEENQIYTIDFQSFPESIDGISAIIYPLIVIVDSKGTVMKNLSLASYESISSNTRGFVGIRGVQEFYAPNDEKYYIVVLTDNATQKGSTITTIMRETNFVYKLRRIPAQRSPTGSFHVIVRKKTFSSPSEKGLP